MQIALAYNTDNALSAGEPDDRIGVQWVANQVDAVEQACHTLGWQSWRIAVDRRLGGAIEALQRRRPDVVFSMVESVDGDCRFEPAMAHVLEWLEIPYTGSPPLALALALEKPLARVVLASAGVLIPPGAVFTNPDDPIRGLRYPLIVKPSREDGSHGIRSESLVADAGTARERIRYVNDRYAQPALVEEFIGGREFSVSLIGPTSAPVPLPLQEIVYSLPEHLPRLLSYEAKWMPHTLEYQGTLPATPVDLAPGLLDALTGTACAAYSCLGLRDYGRVDLRLNALGEPVVLDVNPNPELAPREPFGLAGAALRAGMSYSELVAFVVEQAVARQPRSPRVLGGQRATQRGSNQTGR